jgi:dihydrofolate reductase
MCSPDSRWGIPPSPRIHAYAGEVRSLVENIRQHTDRDIWLVGGADRVQQFLEERGIDELILAYMPLLIGDGIRLFQPHYPTQHWQLRNAHSFPSGVVLSHYRRRE